MKNTFIFLYFQNFIFNPFIYNNKILMFKIVNIMRQNFKSNDKFQNILFNFLSLKKYKDYYKLMQPNKILEKD